MPNLGGTPPGSHARENRKFAWFLASAGIASASRKTPTKVTIRTTSTPDPLASPEKSLSPRWPTGPRSRPFDSGGPVLSSVVVIWCRFRTGSVQGDGLASSPIVADALAAAWLRRPGHLDHPRVSGPLS